MSHEQAFESGSAGDARAPSASNEPLRSTAALPGGAFGVGPAGQGGSTEPLEDLDGDELADETFEHEVGLRGEELVARARGLMGGPRRGRKPPSRTAPVTRPANPSRRLGIEDRS